MERKLKVGDSFEVFKTLENEIKAPVSHFGILLKKMEFSDYLMRGGYFNSSCIESKSTFLFLDSEVKQIGKLTVTKLK